MKHNLLKISLLGILSMFFGSMHAEEVTLAYTGGTTTNMTGENDAATVGLDATAWSVVGEKGNNNNFPGLNKAGDIRLYWSADGGGNTLTVESLTGATINSIAIEFTGEEYSNVSVSVGGNAVAATDGAYAINASSFVLGNANESNIQVRMKSIVITYTPGSVVDTRVATSITLGDHQTTGAIGAELDLPTATVMAGETAVSGAVITWTSSDESVAAINGSKVTLKAAGTATITAEYAGDANYHPSSAKYMVTACETYTSISAMLADISSDKVNVLYSFENLLIVCVMGSYTYVYDGQDYFLLYGSNLGLNAGDKVSGSVSGQLYTYNNLPELSTYADKIDVTVTSSGNNINPVAITVAELGSNLNRYVTISNAVFVSANKKNLTFKVGETEFVVYNQLGLSDDVIATLEADKAYDLTGFEGCYKDTKQLFLVEFVDHQETDGIHAGMTTTVENGWYNLQGQHVSSPTRGMYVLVQTRPDGTRTSRTVIVR